MDIFSSWQFYLIGGYISSIVFLQSYKKAVRTARNNGAATVLLQLISTATLLFLIPFYEIKFPSEIKWYFLLGLASVFYAFNDRAQTTVRKNLEVSEYTILNQLKTVAMIAMGVMFFREEMMLNKIIGAGLILLANALVVFRANSFKMNRYVWIAIFAAIASSIGLSIDVGVSDLFNLPLYIAITFVVPMAIIALVERIRLEDVLSEIRGGNKAYYLATGIIWPINTICFIRAYQLGSITVVAPLLAITVLLNVIFASIIHKERDHFWKKIVAAILVIIGVIILT